MEKLSVIEKYCAMIVFKERTRVFRNKIDTKLLITP